MQVAPVSDRGIVEGRGNRGGIREAFRNLGMTRQTVERSLEVAALSPEAKTAAREAGLDGNQSALLKAAKEKSPDRQVAALEREIMEKANDGRERQEPVKHDLGVPVEGSID